MVSSVAYIYQNVALPKVQAYTAFIIAHHLKSYTRAYMDLLIQYGIDPDLYLPPTETQATEERFYESSYEYLTLLSEGRWHHVIETSLNDLSLIGIETTAQLKAKTNRLFLIGYIGRKACRLFIKEYTDDVVDAMLLVEEIDHYNLVFERAINESYQKSLLALLELREKHYQEAQRMAHIGNWSLDVTEGKVKYSEEVNVICGWRQAYNERLIKDVRSLLQPGDWDELCRRYFQLKHSAIPLFYIATIKLADNEEKIIELKARSVKDSEQGRQLIGTIQDVTIEQGRIRSLQERERLYRHSEIMANIGSWSIEFHTGYTTFSEGLFRIYEMEPHKGPVNMLVPKSYADPADRKRIDEYAARCREEGIRYDIQYWITLPEGHRKLLHCMAEAVNDANGQRYGMIGTIRDITEVHEMINQLKHNELLYKQAQAIGRIGNWANDLTAGTVVWSEELYRLFEVDAADIDAREIASRRILDPGKAELENHLVLCETLGIPYECQYKVAMPDGNIRHFCSRGEAIRDDRDQIIKMIGTVQDITNQVTVESRLRDQQLFTQKITDIAPTMISVYDVKTYAYVFINLAVEKMLGYSHQEVLENGLGMIIDKIHPDDKEQVLVDWQASLRLVGEGQEPIAEFKYRILHNNGTYKWLHTFAAVFQRDDYGRAAQMIHICIDVSAEKTAEQVLNQKNLLLSQSNSSLEEFAFIASHDLQEPLRKISTFGNMVQTLQEDRLSDSGKLYLGKIVDSSIRMQAMINDLLSVSIIAGNRSFEKEDLQALLEEVFVTLEHKIELTGALIKQDQPLPMANVIASQFRQLFQNLISNSLKFAQRDVTPVVHINSIYVKGSELDLKGINQDRRYLKITFSDNGIGFSNDYASKIFIIFQRLHGRSEYEGTGIGLAVCRKIAEHHNGFIYADGEIGKGACFTVVLPVN